MKKVATIILNRNLPFVTDSLYEHLAKYDSEFTDIYVVEAGSDHDSLSKYTSWHADWPEAIKSGLRYARGMNYGLSQLYKENKFESYEAFFLITHDTELNQKATISPLLKILESHPKVGILSPCSERWGERILLESEQTTKYFWFIHKNAYLLRRSFVENIYNHDEVNCMQFLFDGSNFRGYGLESELIAKAYINDWAAAITSDVFINQEESYLIDSSQLIKTDDYKTSLTSYVEEGRKWMLKKYGFRSRWSMQQYVKLFYDKFFYYYPEYKKYRI